MTDQVAHLALHVQAPDAADVEEVAELTLRLRRELLELDIEAAELVSSGDVPPGARAVETLALGGLIVTFIQSSGLLAAVVNAVQSWVGGLGPRSVRLELHGDVLEVAGISSREQRQLITTWVERHAS